MPQVGPIPTLQVLASIQASIQGASGTNSNPLLGNRTVPQIGAGISQNFANLTSPPAGTIAASQCKYYPLASIAASGTQTLDLSAASANLLGNAAATFGTGLWMVFWYLPTVASTVGVSLGLTVQASSVTIGNNGGGSNQWLGFLNAAADAIVLHPGDIVGGIRTGATSWVIDGTHLDVLITNNDGTNAAQIVLLALGV